MYSSHIITLLSILFHMLRHLAKVNMCIKEQQIGQKKRGLRGL